MMNPFRHTDENTSSVTKHNPQTAMLFLFAAFMFAQFVILRMGNRAGSGLLPKPQQELVYFFLQIIVIGGFLTHALLHSLLHTGQKDKLLTAIALGLLLSGAVMMLFMSPDSWYYLIITGVSILLLGYVGGAVYVRLSEFTASYKHAGVCIGTGYATAVALQYVLQLQWEIKSALAVLLVLSFAVMGFLLLKSNRAQLPPKQETQTVSRSALVFSAVITLALLLFSSYYNSYIHHLQIASGYTDYNVYSLPRLLMIPTVMLFGWIGDFKGGRLLPVCTLCVVSVALLNTALLARETYFLNMCLYYVALTAVIAYYHLTFLRLAARTKPPALWACIGRVLDSAVVILSFCFQFAKLSQVAVLMIDVAALAVVIVTMALNGNFNLVLPAPEPKQETAPAKPETDPFEAVREQYHLTPAELRVFRELVLTEDKQAVIGDRLSIKLRTVQANVTSIYRKTGMNTRSGLVQLYHNAVSDK